MHDQSFLDGSVSDKNHDCTPIGKDGFVLHRPGRSTTHPLCRFLCLETQIWVSWTFARNRERTLATNPLLRILPRYRGGKPIRQHQNEIKAKAQMAAEVEKKGGGRLIKNRRDENPRIDEDDIPDEDENESRRQKRTRADDEAHDDAADGDEGGDEDDDDDGGDDDDDGCGSDDDDDGGADDDEDVIRC